MGSCRAATARPSDAAIPPPPESQTRRRVDAHFFSRLERLTEDHIALALAIYRDRQLVRMIFALAHLQQVDRIAISLGHPNQGPFVLVTRHGNFVTCLGEGMSAWPTPVVPRKLLIEMRTRIEATRRNRLSRE